MHVGALFARFRHAFAVAGNADWGLQGAIKARQRGSPSSLKRVSTLIRAYPWNLCLSESVSSIAFTMCILP